jgi:hypothetical protein
MRGSGKSYFAEHLIRSNILPTVIYDGATHEHSNLGEVHTKLDFKLDKKNIVYQPLDDTPDDFENFCNYVWKNCSNCVVVIEELANYTTSNYISPYFSRICRIGRHRGMGVIGITQRPARLSLIFMSQCDHLFIFRQRLIRDLDFLSEWSGTRINEKIAALKEYKFLHCDLSHDKITEEKPVKSSSADKTAFRQKNTQFQ